jgi:phage tail tape-measure protein
MERPTSPHSQRLRTLRRRVAAGVLATFVAAWLAVAALGKGGGSTAAASSTTSSESTGTQTQSEPSQSEQSQDSQPGPVVTGQS